MDDNFIVNDDEPVKTSNGLHRYGWKRELHYCLGR